MGYGTRDEQPDRGGGRDIFTSTPVQGSPALTANSGSPDPGPSATYKAGQAGAAGAQSLWICAAVSSSAVSGRAAAGGLGSRAERRCRPPNATRAWRRVLGSRAGVSFCGRRRNGAGRGGAEQAAHAGERDDRAVGEPAGGVRAHSQREVGRTLTAWAGVAVASASTRADRGPRSSPSTPRAAARRGRMSRGLDDTRRAGAWRQ